LGDQASRWTAGAEKFTGTRAFQRLSIPPAKATITSPFKRAGGAVLTATSHPMAGLIAAVAGSPMNRAEQLQFIYYPLSQNFLGKRLLRSNI